MHLKFDEPHYRSTFKIQLTRRFKDARDFEKSNTHDNTVSMNSPIKNSKNSEELEEKNLAHLHREAILSVCSTSRST